MRRADRVAVVGAVVMALAGASSYASDGPGDSGRTSRSRTRPCSDATLRGAYGIQMQGTRPSGPPPAPAETVNGVVLRIYDGEGGFTQFDNVKGSITGIPPATREGAGTYVVNADCTGETLFDPGNGVVIVERLQIVRGGREVFTIVASPAPVMVSTVQKKVND
jgi:hypothetical protein